MIARSLFAFLVLLGAIPCQGQYEHLATLNYNTLALNRVSPISGMTWVTGNSTYDQNQQRFFFQGSLSQSGPFNLYTIDAQSGATIYAVPCPLGIAGNIEGPQYDNGTDTLYALMVSAGNVSFVWIDPASGSAHVISTLTNYQGFSESTFDARDHIYIVNSGNDLLGINAATGTIAFSWANAVIPNLQFDNLSGKLYGTNASLQQFDSISLSTGVLHPIAGIPLVSFPQIYCTAIDEQAGKYIFLGSTNSPSGCVLDTLYVLDINTGAILSRQFYPFAQAVSVISSENVIEYSMDNKRGIMYALNWYPPAGSTGPGITISASPGPYCPGSKISFTAQGATGNDLHYQWQVDGQNAGTNNPVFSGFVLSSGDTVRCIVTHTGACIVTPGDTSNSLPVLLVQPAGASIDIHSSASTICSGDTVLFYATSVDGGSAPVYDWQINGVSSGEHHDTLITVALRNNDTVSCILASSLTCTPPVASANRIVMTVLPRPVIRFHPDTLVIRPGETPTLMPVITGTISNYNWLPGSHLSNPSVEDPVASPILSITYQLQVTADNGCQASGKISILVYYPILMPAAFSPNGDGNNDVFRIPMSSQQPIRRFEVFNRWGELLFRTADPAAGWDGNYKEQPQAAGIYVWQIEYEHPILRIVIVEKGTVMLVR